MDDANKEFWRVGCGVARLAPKTGIVVLHSRTALAVQAEIEHLRALASEALETAGHAMPVDLLRRFIVALDQDGPR